MFILQCALVGILYYISNLYSSFGGFIVSKYTLNVFLNARFCLQLRLQTCSYFCKGLYLRYLCLIQKGAIMAKQLSLQRCTKGP